MGLELEQLATEQEPVSLCADEPEASPPDGDASGPVKAMMKEVIKGIIKEIKEARSEVEKEGKDGNTKEEFNKRFAERYPEDTFMAEFRKRANERAVKMGYYSGVPMPLDHHRLCFDPKHPLYKEFNGFRTQTSKQKNQKKAREEIVAISKQVTEINAQANGLTTKKEVEQETGIKKIEKARHEIVNQWYCKSLNAYIYIYRDMSTGKNWFWTDYSSTGPGKRVALLTSSLEACEVWTLEAEERAEGLLKTYLSYEQFKQYRIAGAFYEESPRSGLTYIFRRMRPTIVLGRVHLGYQSVLGSICLHPDSYYESTFAGSMCPTDDVIAHLLLMRTDEYKFWKKGNLHPLHEPEGGI